MLYERWRETARNFRNETALWVMKSGERRTFGQLAAEAEKNCGDTGPVAFPQGPQSILTLLRAWRLEQPACPLEEGQGIPALQSLPPGCAHLKITSATSGEPRMVAFTEAQLAADAENIVATMGLRRDWPNLGAISLAHSYGFSNLVLPLLLHGIPLVLAESPLPENVRAASGNFESITLPAVPALWRTWHDAAAIPRNVRLAISAGAPLPLQLEDAVFESSGLKLHNFYGSSECGGIAYDTTTVPRNDAGCVGSAMKNVELSVGVNGCLEVRGSAVGETYWPEASAALANGCFRTSDIVDIDGGLVFLRGRAGDLINVAGRKLSPESIERVLQAHPDVRECLVFGVPSRDDGRSETVVACVAVRQPVSEDRLRGFLLEKIPAWQTPREWVFVESLETNQRGKLSRSEWREKFLTRCA